MASLAPARFFRLASRPARLQRHAVANAAQRRYITAEEKPLPVKETPGKGPNQDQLPHVSEEAAALGKITGEGGPELEQGTPIQEVIQRDREGAKKAPEILKEPMNSTKQPAGSRSFSTSTRRPTELAVVSPKQRTVAGAAGHIFGLPVLPLPPHSHLRHRYPPIIDRVTRLLMRHGKLAQAQTNMARILDHLRTSPAPKINPARPLIPNAPPAAHLPLNPVEYLTCAIDSIAPLVRIKTMRGMAGGGATLPVPMPMDLWQRRRQAMMWILEAVEKKPTRGAGHGTFATKVAEEVIAIVEGRSGLWERRQILHKLGTTSRANVARMTGRRR